MPRAGTQYWVGLDGEGIGRTPHRFTLLAYADAQGRGAHIENRRGLGTAECLSFLLQAPTNARLAGYYLGYDWTKILVDLPDLSIYRLLRPELRLLPKVDGAGFSRVRWKGFKLHYLAGMMRIENARRKVTIWDLGKFFQAPFVDSLIAWKIDAPVDEIATMKGERSTFAPDDTERIRRYCLQECAALATLASELENANASIGLRPKVWFGPGSTASVGMRKMGIAGLLGESPAPMVDPVSRAFFGGRFEHSCIGEQSNVEAWDIVSAYPYHAYKLPCLHHGKWESVTANRSAGRIDTARHALVKFRITDIGDEPWGPLPIRLANGNIVFPRSGATGWAWRDEWHAARDGWKGVEWANAAWVLESDCDCQPFADILEWFRQRIALGKTQRGRALKLFLNSLYGKLAQTVGNPRYASRIWAGMITSGTRAQLARLITAHSDRSNVRALATDGLYTTETVTPQGAPLAPDTLGAWERTVYDGMVFVRPGIYWSTGDDNTVKARGLPRKQLFGQRAGVLAAIKRGDERAAVGTTTLFGGARACVYQNPHTGKLKRSRFYGEWHDIPARIGLTPAPKRRLDWSLHELGGVDSAPYRDDVRSDDARQLHAQSELFWAML